MFFLTFGLYYYYWLFKTGKELAEAKEENYRSDLWMFIGIITGIGMLYVLYMISKMASEYTGTGSQWKYFILFLILAPVSVYLVQRDINQKAPDVDETALPATTDEDVFTRIGLFVYEYWWAILPILGYIAYFGYLLSMIGFFDLLSLAMAPKP